MLKSFLSEIKDYRRKEGRRYELGYILLFSIFAILSGADSYRKIHTFIKGKYGILRDKFGLKWKKIPAYTTIRNIIIGLSATDLEECFRKYSLKLSGLSAEKSGRIFIACDGKTLRGSFDNFNDKKAIQIFSAFLSESGIIPAHCEIGEKTDEIPVAQNLMKESGSENVVFTYDAINCQEKTLKAAGESNNNVIVCVKGNQKTLLNDCRNTCELGLPGSEYQEPVVKERNRIESRKVGVFEDMIITEKKMGKYPGDSENRKNKRYIRHKKEGMEES
ncbi:MAG: ISAs1 family transposase [Desulfobacteraceae bacterium]|nr:ISAs1 family transposase [Desulfobacteraceae bacterium]